MRLANCFPNNGAVWLLVPERPLFKARGGKPMGKDHPMAWIRKYEGGRFAYTMIGHDTRPLDTDFGEDHLLRLIRWAAGAED